MKFEAPLIRGELVRRYKRFLADVVLADGSETPVHCPNTGSMLGCQASGSTVWLLPVDNPKRKYPLGWELVEARASVLVGINTGRSNALVAEALARGWTSEAWVVWWVASVAYMENPATVRTLRKRRPEV